MTIAGLVSVSAWMKLIKLAWIIRRPADLWPSNSPSDPSHMKDYSSGGHRYRGQAWRSNRPQVSKHRQPWTYDPT